MEDIKIGNDVSVGVADYDTVALDILDAIGGDGEQIEGGVYLFLSTAHATKLANAILTMVKVANDADSKVEIPGD
ncbi:hypothetical protein [Massilia aquatica]|uniref:Uncharacterized protein n=1 Tax=Massilia aquatica TaxID=2609000 RepID=A0ABX0M6G9_9BURK|nr:hypothetical protein [Massilia aquatica]NHZ40095.1 hypothetical protein [Massilia aquatica]